MLFRVHASSSAGNMSTWHDDSGASIAIDFGLSPADAKLALGHRVSSLDAVLLSHHHGDHSRGIEAALRGGVRVCASAGCIDKLGRVPSPHNLVTLHDRVEARISTLACGSLWRVMPFLLRHDAPGTMGFLVDRVTVDAQHQGRLLYICDTAYVPYTFRNVTTLAIECNYSELALLTSMVDVTARMRVLKNHLSLERLLGWLPKLDKSQLQEIHLLHLSNHHGDAELFRSEVARATGVPTYVGPVRREGL